jgi:LmbE family N-acetylglucosaminyl deacetylase
MLYYILAKLLELGDAMADTKAAQVLVFTPHPDDAEFGVAGTVALWAKQGMDVVYAVCTNGDKGTSDPKMTPEKLAEIREKEQLAAADVLGVSEVVFLRYPDQGLEDTPEFRKELVRLIRKYRPDIVVSSNPYRKYIWHRDHRICGRVVMDAVFPFARDRLSYPDLLEEGLEPYKVKEVWLWGSEDANHLSDITDTFDIKVAALCCHVSQVGGIPKEDLEKRMRERYRSFAEGEDFDLAEAFHKLEILR